MTSQAHYNIVHLDRATIGPNIILSKPQISHHWTSYERTSADEVVPRLKDADIAVLNKVQITAEILHQLPELKMIVLSATGYDKIDIAA